MTVTATDRKDAEILDRIASMLDSMSVKNRKNLCDFLSTRSYSRSDQAYLSEWMRDAQSRARNGDQWY